MRDFKGMKRQRGRNRGGSSGGPPKHNANRSFDSNGPEGIKVRGAAQGVFEKYQQLARDAASAGDRVLAENYLQHAEHYFRVVRAMQPTRPASDIIGKEGFSGGFDIDFEAEPEEAVVEVTEANDGQGDTDGGEQQRSYDNNGNNNGRRDDRQDRPRYDNNNRGDRPERNFDRNDGGQNNNQGNNQGANQGGQGQGQSRRDRPWRDRDDRPRDEQRPRDDRPRDDRPRDDRPREQSNEPRAEREPRRERFERNDRPEREPVAAVETTVTAPPRADEAPAARSPRLRGQDGTMSDAPAFLSRAPERAPVAAAASEDADAAPKVRRGRPKKIVASEGDI